MKTRNSIIRCAVAAVAMAFAAAAHPLTQGDDNGTAAAPAGDYYGHGCCGDSRAHAGHHGCRPAGFIAGRVPAAAGTVHIFVAGRPV